LPSNRPIGVFDSGVGGLSVLRRIEALLPQENYIYVADSAYAPYGARPRQEIIQRSLAIADWLVRQGAKALVVACNTATSAAVEVLRERFTQPVVAMEPALKPAAAATRSGKLAVLATAGTLRSDRYQRLLDAHGHQVQVSERICHHWVELVEQGQVRSPAARKAVVTELQPLLAAGVDVLVLGCTHFPFLEPLLQEIAGSAVQIIDPAPAVARRLAEVLRDSELTASPANRGSVQCLTSGEPARVGEVIRHLGLPYGPVEPLPRL